MMLQGIELMLLMRDRGWVLICNVSTYSTCKSHALIHFGLIIGLQVLIDIMNVIIEVK